MNYYSHHIGDYRRNTSHLSLLEHGIYRQLLDTYYLSEQPISSDLEIVYRKLCARTDDERNVVEGVLREFFKLTKKGWVHAQCEKEIKAYKGKADRARDNGKLGGRPKETKRVISGLSEKTEQEANQEPRTTNHEPVTCNHEPRTKNQKPLERGDKHTEVINVPHRFQKNRACVEPPNEMRDPLQPRTADLCCKALAKQGIQGCNPHHPTLVALLKAGASEEEFTQAAISAATKGKKQFEYVLGIVRRQREEAASLVLHQGRMPNKQEALEEANRRATAGWMPPELREKNHAS
jgi:uncharacterized protein YdaU (DUF1376 family)